MPDDHDDRLTILERAQLLHDATLRRHGELLDRLEEERTRHANHMAHLEILMEQQSETQTTLREIALRLAARQDQHEAVMLRLAQTLDAIKDLLEHAHTALCQQDVLGSLQGRVAFDNQLILRMGGHTLVHPVPLSQRDHDGPRQRWPRRQGW